MALSGTINKDFGGGYRVQIEWIATQNISANTSTITAKFYLISLGSGYNINSTVKKTVRIKIDETTYTSADQTAQLEPNQKKLMATATKTITHNADGTRSFYIGGSIDINVTLSGTWYGTVTIPDTQFTLNTILRASSVSVSPSSVNFGKSVTINISRHSSDFTHTLRYSVAGQSGTIATGVDTSYNWTVPNNFMNYIPNNTFTIGTIYVDTYNGTKLVGTKSVSLEINVPSSVVPSFSSISHSEQNSAVAALNLGSGVYAQNLSKIKFTINGAAGAYGSTITSYKIVYDGTTYNSSSATTGTIKNSGTRTVTATITDSRGRTASKSATVSVLAYNSPSISSFSVRRCNEDGSNNDVGEYIEVTYGGSMSNLNSKNTATVYIDTKPRSSSTWTTKNSFAITGSFSGTKIFGTYEITQSYDVRIRVIDKFYTVTSTKQLSTAVVTMSWGKQGVGIGKVWERGALDVGGNAFIGGTLDVEGNMYVTSSIIMPANRYYEANNQQYVLNLNNSDIIGLNCLYFKDACDLGGEGINFYRAADVWDTLYARNGELYFHPNRDMFQNIAGHKIWHSGNDGPGSGLDADLLDGKNSSYFQPASDERLKTDIQPITNALDKVLALQGVSFIWNEKAEEISAKRETLAGREIGLIAQQVAEVVPEVILDWIETEDGEKYKTVDTARMVALLVEAIKELNAKVAAIEQRLEGEIA